jgi:hypothetical protein
LMRRPLWIPIEISWNLFHDQFTTPPARSIRSRRSEAGPRLPA